MKISIIIPAYDEEECIVKTVGSVLKRAGGFVKEVIVVDGGSSDQTVKRAQTTPATVVASPRKGRAAQMNYGASVSQGNVLYFLHADSIPPENFDQKIMDSVDRGNPAGCFRLAFDTDHPLLNFYAWCTRFDVDAFRFGDQSLFITKKLFNKIKGFKEDHIVMEDHEIIKRIKKHASFLIGKDSVTTSSRKYMVNGVVKLQGIFTLIFTLYKMGVSQSKLVLIYKKLIH